jgi:DNA-binding NtrC family response regulator
VVDEAGAVRLADRVAAMERTEIAAALRRARGVKSRAAEALGLSRPTLDKKMADLGIDIWRADASDGSDADAPARRGRR